MRDTRATFEDNVTPLIPLDGAEVDNDIYMPLEHLFTQQCISTDTLSNQVAGSRQGSTILPSWNHPVSPQPGGSTAPNVSSPIPPSSTYPPSSTLAVNKYFMPLTTPLNAIRYDKLPTM